MKAELRDGHTLVLTAESVAEHEVLKRFEGVTLRTEVVKPFTQNIQTLIAEAKT